MEYQLDPTGKSLRNKVISETKPISLLNGKTHLFIIPFDGPYYEESLFIKYTPAVGEEKILFSGVDYFPVLPYSEATRKFNAPIFAGIEFIDLTLNGTVTYAYQTMGGAYSTDQSTITGIEVGFSGDPRFTTWDSLVTLPDVPEISHPWSVANVDNIANAVDELEKIGVVVHLRPRFLPSPSEEVFIPTAQEIGLGFVPNYPPATDQQAILGEETQSLMTPATTKLAVNAEVTRALSDIGYLVPVQYAGSIYITNPKTTVDHQGRIYAINPQAVPYTTTGQWDTDKQNFITVRAADVEDWSRLTLMVAGDEEVIDVLGRVLVIDVEHDSSLLPQLILNDVIFLVHGLDYKMSNNRLYVKYPTQTGDKLVLHTKRSAVNTNRDKQINKVFVVQDGSNTFDVSDVSVSTSNLRVSINEFIILDSESSDYSILNGVLTINYPIGLGDVIEVENIDSTVLFGKMFLRNLAMD
jgi:hypothetical protein